LLLTVQVKALFRNPRIIGRNFPICQLELSGVKLEISSRQQQQQQQLAVVLAVLVCLQMLQSTA
jgi:hypothetical protein